MDEQREDQGSQPPQADIASDPVRKDNVPVYVAPNSSQEGKSGKSFLTGIVRYLVLSILVLSLIVNVYLFAIVASGMQEEVYLEGDELNKIALIDLQGTINMETADDIRRHLKKAAADETIKGVILVVNCPGGQVAPSNMINHAIQNFQKETGKKVYSSIQQLGASGAYWISAAADKIYGQTNAIIGSIGVIYMSFVAEKTLKEKLGVEPVIIKSSQAPFKDRGPPFRHPSEEERLKVQQELDTVHQRFVDVIVQGRGMDEEQVQALADGDVHDGPTALEKKLIDEVGFLEDAIDDMAQELSLKDPKVIRYRKPGGLADLLAAKAQIENPFDIRSQVEKFLTEPKIVALWPNY